MELNQENSTGKKLRILREIHNYTQEDVATQMNLKQKAYSSLETGEIPLNLEQYEQLATVYKMKATDLFYYLQGNEKFLIQYNTINSKRTNVGSNQRDVNMQQYGLATKEKALYKKEINLLKEEIKLLKSQLEQFNNKG